MNNKVKNSLETGYNHVDKGGYVSTLVEGGIEYSKDNTVYIFKDGTLTMIEQLDWGGDNEFPLSYAYIYENTPKKIVYTSKNDDKSQSNIHIEISLEKTAFNNSREGHPISGYEISTPLDVWLKLSQTFNWDKFYQLKNGILEDGGDGLSRIITVETESGIFSLTNYGENELEEFLKIILDYYDSIY